MKNTFIAFSFLLGALASCGGGEEPAA